MCTHRGLERTGVPAPERDHQRHPRRRAASRTKVSRASSPAWLSERRPRVSSASGVRRRPGSRRCRGGRPRGCGEGAAPSTSRYASSPAPSGSPTSRRRALLAEREVVLAVHAEGEDDGSVANTAAVPFPWCTSRSTTSGAANAPRGLQRAHADRDVVEDAVALAVVGKGVVRAPGEVPADALHQRGARPRRRSRRPLRVSAGRARAPGEPEPPRLCVGETVARPPPPPSAGCARGASAASSTGSAGTSSVAWSTPDASSASRSSRYLPIGKRCPAGSGTTWWSE